MFPRVVLRLTASLGKVVAANCRTTDALSGETDRIMRFSCVISIRRNRLHDHPGQQFRVAHLVELFNRQTQKASWLPFSSWAIVQLSKS
jgi:hypothetical protein